jgi:hypothetical protein
LASFDYRRRFLNCVTGDRVEILERLGEKAREGSYPVCEE